MSYEKNAHKLHAPIIVSPFPNQFQWNFKWGKIIEANSTDMNVLDKLNTISDHTQ